MKKILLFVFVITASMMMHNQPVMAENDSDLLSATGTASINAEPDTAVFTVAVETENKLLTQAMQENTDKSRKVISEIKKLLGKDDSISTIGFNANPLYNYDNKERKSVLSGYRVTDMLKIKTKKISDAGKFMDTAITCGANRTEDLDFILENTEKYSGELLKKASESAKQKASFAASALNVRIKGIQRASVNFSDEPISHYYRGSFSLSEMKSVNSVSAPPIEAGEVKLNATVSVDFLIEDIK